MRGKTARSIFAALIVYSACSAGYLFGQAATATAREHGLTVASGSPLEVALVKSVPIKRPGIQVEGVVIHPVYVYDRLVIPAGSQVFGTVTQVEPVSRKRRLEALANGDFTPLRTAHIGFDTLVLKDGAKLHIATSVSQGVPNVIHLTAGSAGKKKGRVKQKAAQIREAVKQRERESIAEVKAPGKWQRFKALMWAQLPYRRQSFPAGTQFTAVLTAPLQLGMAPILPLKSKLLGGEAPPGSIVHVRLITALSSATTKRGAPVRAVISQPVFSSGGQLILPQGTQLEGRVTQAVPARRFARNGKLRFTFLKVDVPTESPRVITATLAGVDAAAAAHMKLDSEGGARAITPKTRYIAPAIDVVLAMSSLDGLDPHRRLHPGFHQGPDIAGGVVRGGAGFGLVGSVVGLAARWRPVSAVFAFYGAGWTVYSHLIERGTDVVFPLNTPMEILFGNRESSASADTTRGATRNLPATTRRTSD